MEPIAKSATGPVVQPTPRPQAAASDTAAPGLGADQAQFGGGARGIKIEVVTNYLLFKRKQVFSLMPQPDGKVVFTQSDGSGKVVTQRTVGQAGTPTQMAIDVNVAGPFVSQHLRLELAHDRNGSSIKVTDLKSGKVLRQASSNE